MIFDLGLIGILLQKSKKTEPLLPLAELGGHTAGLLAQTLELLLERPHLHTCLFPGLHPFLQTGPMLNQWKQDQLQ